MQRRCSASRPGSGARRVWPSMRKRRDAFPQLHAAAQPGRLRRLVVPAHVVRLLVEQRVHDRAVQALGVVLDHELPVGLQVVDAALGPAQLAHAPRGELAVQAGQVLRKRERARRQVYEDVAVPLGRGDAAEAVLPQVESDDLLHERRGAQRAVEAVGPGVVRALDAAGQASAVLAAQERAAVPAGVVERGDVALLVAQHDQVHAGEAHQEVAAGRVERLRPSGVEPHVVVNRVELAAEELRVGVVARRQRPRFGGVDLRSRVLVAGGHGPTPAPRRRARARCAGRARARRAPPPT